MVRAARLRSTHGLDRTTGARFQPDDLGISLHIAFVSFMSKPIIDLLVLLALAAAVALGFWFFGSRKK